MTLVGTLGTCVGALAFFPRESWLVGTLVIVALRLQRPARRHDGADVGPAPGPWGAFLDSTLDRVADGAVFGGMVLGFAARRRHAAPQRVALACLVGGAVVSYAKARAESIGVECNVGIAERAERLIVALLAAFLYGLGVPYVPAGGPVAAGGPSPGSPSGSASCTCAGSCAP